MNEQKIFFSIVAVIALIIFSFGFYMTSQSEKFEVHCTKNNGVVVKTPTGVICIDAKEIK